jgi:hypothetical protein
MFTRVARNDATVEDAARAAESEITGIAARWKNS